jgi:hypothetical protein
MRTKEESLLADDVERGGQRNPEAPQEGLTLLGRARSLACT